MQGAGALIAVSCLPAFAAESALPDIPAMARFIGSRTVRWERLRLVLPRLADNGFAVPIKMEVAGPFTPASFVAAIHLFSETNPVPEMAVFEFAAPLARVELESRIRLAGTQQIVALALMSDGALYGAIKEVIVTLAGCMDGT